MKENAQVGPVVDDPLAGVSPEYRAILERQIQALEREATGLDAANAEVLPGALWEAYGALPKVVAGLRVRRFVHWDWVLLRRLESPLLKQLQRAPGAEATHYTDLQGCEMVFQFTRPNLECELLMQQVGEDGFRRVAQEVIGRHVGPVEVNLLIRMVERELMLSFATAVKYAKGTEGGGQTVFSTPPAQATGLAGGSTICAD